MMLFALFWGFAEATLFFIVPDMLLTAIAVKSLRRGMRACLWALTGALLGGSLMYAWGILDPPQSVATVIQVPAIDEAMVEKVKEDLIQKGLPAIVLGPTQGIPYKIFATQSPTLGIGFLPFLLTSIPARLIRFVGTTLITDHGMVQPFSVEILALEKEIRPLAGRVDPDLWGVFFGSSMVNHTNPGQTSTGINTACLVNRRWLGTDFPMNRPLHS